MLILIVFVCLVVARIVGFVVGFVVLLLLVLLLVFLLSFLVLKLFHVDSYCFCVSCGFLSWRRHDIRATTTSKPARDITLCSISLVTKDWKISYCCYCCCFLLCLLGFPFDDSEHSVLATISSWPPEELGDLVSYRRVADSCFVLGMESPTSIVNWQCLICVFLLAFVVYLLCLVVLRLFLEHSTNQKLPIDFVCRQASDMLTCMLFLLWQFLS